MKENRPTHILDKTLQQVLQTICLICFVLLFRLLAGNVLIRNFPVMEMYWFDEVVEFAFAWLVFIGAARLWAADAHFKLLWLPDRIKDPRRHSLFRIAIEIISLIFLAVFTWQSLRLTLLARDWTPVFNVSKRFLYVCMPISGVVMTGYSLAAIVREACRLISPDSRTETGSETGPEAGPTVGAQTRSIIGSQIESQTGLEKGTE